jgi:hypothetical protein
VLIDAAPGARCAQHRRRDWDTSKASQSKLDGYPGSAQSRVVLRIRAKR